MTSRESSSIGFSDGDSAEPRSMSDDPIVDRRAGIDRCPGSRSAICSIASGHAVERRERKTGRRGR